MKNEHIVYAYADRQDAKGKVLVIGLTPTGLEYLKANPGMSLTVNPPGTAFMDVANVLVFSAESKQAIKDIFARAGQMVSEVH